MHVDGSKSNCDWWRWFELWYGLVMLGCSIFLATPFSLSGPLYLLFWAAWSSIEINVHGSNLLTYHLGKHGKPQQKLIPKGSVTFGVHFILDTPMIFTLILSLVLHHHPSSFKHKKIFSLFLWCPCPWVTNSSLQISVNYRLLISSSQSSPCLDLI